MSEGYQYIEVEGDRIERLTFRRSEMPGALVEVTINREKINVEPKALLLAVKTIAHEN